MDFEVFSRVRAGIQKSVKKYAFGKTFSQIAENERVKSNKLNYCVQKTSFEKRFCRYSNCVIFFKKLSEKQRILWIFFASLRVCGREKEFPAKAQRRKENRKSVFGQIFNIGKRADASPVA